MQNCSIDEKGNLHIEASENSSKIDFDFYEGKWIIRNRKLKNQGREANNMKNADPTSLIGIELVLAAEGQRRPRCSRLGISMQI